jgi:hypothetical protein
MRRDDVGVGDVEERKRGSSTLATNANPEGGAQGVKGHVKLTYQPHGRSSSSVALSAIYNRD